jgi:autotransporter translocation and assembly factor TamB
MDLASRFSGRGATPQEIARALTGSGSFTATQGKFAATPTTKALWQALNLGEESIVPFRDLAAAFQVKEGRIVTDGIDVRGANATWKASGSLGFDGQLDYRLQVELDDQLSSLYRKRLGGELAKLLENDSGRLTLDLTLAGPAAKPKVTVDTSKLADRARQNLGDALRGRLDQGVKRLLGGGGTTTPPPDSTGNTPGGGG